MSTTDIISFSRQLADGSLMQIAITFLPVPTIGNTSVTAAVDGVEPPVKPVAAAGVPRASSERHPDDTDAAFLERLVDNQAPPRMLSEWAKDLGISLRKLTAEKAAGRIEFVRRQETRAGNAHLVSAKEMLKAVKRLMPLGG